MSSTRDRARHAALAAVAIYIVLSVTWSYVIPLGGGIDEPRHVRYVQIVAEEGRLPTVAEKQEAISHHPPLHYLIAAPVYLATRGLGEDAAWHALRLLSVAMGAGSVILTFLTLRIILPQRPWGAVAGTSFVGLLPHFEMTAAFVSNDATVALFSSLMLYFAVRTIKEPRHAVLWSALAGLAAGAATATKMNGLIPMPAALLAVGLAALVRAPELELERSSRALRNMIAFVTTFALTGGLWIAQHLSKWGTLESDPPWPSDTWPVHGFAERLFRAIEGLYRSTWAQMGWLPGPHSSPPLAPTDLWPRPNLETPILALMLPLTIIGIVGTIVLCMRWLRSDETRARGLATALLVAAFALSYAAVAHSAIYLHPGRHEAGRYALHVAGATMALLAIGPLVLPRRWTVVCWVATVVLLLVMQAVSFWEMHVYMIPTFAPQ